MNGNRLSYLDNMWLSGGIYRLKRTFNELAMRDRQEALRLLDDEGLTFPVLYILMHEINVHKLYTGLNRRNRTAIQICAAKIKRLDISETAADVQDGQTLYEAVRWMFDTGKNWAGPNEEHDDYDAVIDYVSAILVIYFEDREALKDIAGLIFWRNRKGVFIHDLVWSFFQTLDKDALAIIAGYLLSDNQKDVQLAGKLLGLEVPVPSNRGEAKKIHRQCLNWLDDNKPYLYTTGEHFQMTSHPKHFDADKEAKYLGKEISPRYRAPVEPLTENEIECLHRYRASTNEEQELLTNYSHQLRHTDAWQWDAWMHKQVAEQVFAARMNYEVI